MVLLVLGGAASGKSQYAEDRVLQFPGENRVYVATMECFDEESRQRIQRHRNMRAGKGFQTVECPVGLKDVVLPPKAVVLVECISNLTANEIYSPRGAGPQQAAKEILMGAQTLCCRAEHVVFVSNLVFSDGVKYDPSIKEYIQILGEINAGLASMASQVVEVVCGIPVTIKGETV